MADKPIQTQDIASGSLQHESFSALTLIKKTVWFIWHFHRKLVITLLVGFSIVFLSLRVLAFYLEQHPQLVQDFIETQLASSVSFEQLSIDINLFSPVMAMKNFKLASGPQKEGEPLNFESASIQINTMRSLYNGQINIERIAVSGVSLAVKRNTNNELFIADFKLAGQQEKQGSGKKIENYLELFNQTTFSLSNSTINFADETTQFPSGLISDINLKIKNHQSRHQISLLAKLDNSDTQLDLRLDFRGAIHELNKWDGKIYCAIKNIRQQNLLPFFSSESKQTAGQPLQIEHIKINSLQANTKFWSSIKKGSLQSIIGDFVIHNARLAHADDKRKIMFNKISSNFKFARGAQLLEADSRKTVWKLDLFDYISNVNGQIITEKDIKLHFFQNENKQISKLQLFWNYLDLTEVAPVLSFFSPDEFNKQVYKVIKPEGQIKNIIATLELSSLQTPIDIQHYQLQADIEGFGINALYAVPKVRNFSTRIVFNENRGRAYINSSDMQLHLKSLFRDAWPVKSLSGEFFWQQQDEQWYLGAENVQFNNSHLSAEADVNLWLAQNGQTFMDLSGFFHDANVKYVPYYLPSKVMSKGLVNWLDRAFVSGQATDGGVVFRGELAQFPFQDHNGVLDITFNTRNVLLDYQSDWPLLKDINAQVQFTERGMGVESQHSKIFTSVSHNIEAHIENYYASILKLSGDINSNVKDGIHFLKQSQLVSDEVVDILDAEGGLDLNLDVTISLDNAQTDSKVQVKLKNNNYYPPGFERNKGLVSHLNGKVLVHNNSLNSQKLTAKIMGNKANIAIKTDRQNKRSKQDPKISISIDSIISMKELRQFKLIPYLLMPLSDHLSRPTAVNLLIDLPNTQRALAFRLASELSNLKSELPKPFNKPAGKKSSFILSFAERKAKKHNATSNKQQQSQLDIKVSNIMSLALLLNTSGEQFELLKGNIAFTGARAKLPKENVLRINGSLHELPLEQWQSVFSDSEINHKKANSSNPFSIPVELAMKQLVLPEFKHGTKIDDRTSAASKKQLIKHQKPDHFPLINGSIETLKMGNVDFGRFTIKTQRKENTLVFQQIEIDGLLLLLKAQGKWLYNNKSSQVKMEGIAKIPSLEKLLIALGNDQAIRKGKTKLEGSFSWQGGLTDISKENIKGSLHLVSEKGAFIEGKPGAAGRLLGLLNMNALARRLSFDFSDISAKGFEYESIDGHAHIDKGVFIIDDFLIKAPSAKIFISGDTNLLTKHFDQEVIVIPEVSATLPIAGAAVAGPTGAAVVWVGQKLLGHEINKITAFGYTIKGNWDEPTIKKVKINRKLLNKIKKVIPLNKKISKEQDNNPIFSE